MNIGSAIMSIGSLPIAGGRASPVGLKGSSAQDNLKTNTQDISSAVAPKSKADKKPDFHITNTTDDTVESQENTPQSTIKDTSRQDAQTTSTQNQDTDLETSADGEQATASVMAYLVSAGTNDLKTIETETTPPVEESTDVSAALIQEILPTDKTNLLNNPAAVLQDGQPAVQNNDNETADVSKQAGQDIESQKAKLLQQAIRHQMIPQEAAGAKDTTVEETENQLMQKAVSADESTTNTSLSAAAETAYTNQSGNETSDEGQAEKAAGKNNQSKAKLQFADGEQNQQTDTQIGSNSILNKTQTQQSDAGGPHIQTNNKDSGSNEAAFSGLSSNQQVLNDQKVFLAEQTPKDSRNFRLPSDLSGQIQESAKALLQSNKNEITVRLNPPELGSVCLKVSESGSQISGLLQVSKPETQHEIQQCLPEIIRSLEDAGISIKRFEVVLNNPSDQQTLQQSLYQQNNQQGYDSNGQTQAGYQSLNYLFNDANQYQQAGTTQIVGAGTGSLNILM